MNINNVKTHEVIIKHPTSGVEVVIDSATVLSTANCYNKTEIDTMLAGEVNTGVCYTKAESNANYLSANTAYATSTHVHNSTNEQVLYNSGGTIKGDANMTYNAALQTLSVGKVELITGTVSSFRMKAADGTGTIYNVYISGGTFTTEAVV